MQLFVTFCTHVVYQCIADIPDSENHLSEIVLIEKLSLLFLFTWLLHNAPVKAFEEMYDLSTKTKPQTKNFDSSPYNDVMRALSRGFAGLDNVPL